MHNPVLNAASSNIRKSPFYQLALLLSLLLASTQSLASYDTPAVFQLKQGGTITLNQDISDSRGARVHIQNGSVLALSDVEQLEPYCYFYSRRSKEQLKKPLQIQADTFDFSTAYHRREFVHYQNTSHQLASLQLAGLSFSEGGGAQYSLSTQMILNSVNHPQVSRLVCSIWADPRERRHLSMQEIRDTLGAVVTISQQ